VQQRSHASDTYNESMSSLKDGIKNFFTWVQLALPSCCPEQGVELLGLLLAGSNGCQHMAG
jgi:hypothetical protein